MDCIFCKIVDGKIPAKKVHEDAHTLAFHDLNPQAPTHVLIIPKVHVASVDEAAPEHAQALGSLFLTAQKVAAQLGLTQGYRMVVNNGANAGQSVFHIHMHLLGGRVLTWPPG